MTFNVFKYKLVMAFGLIGLMASCTPRVIESTIPFDPQEVAFINARGAASISGQAFLRQNGGGVVTCAGETVYLIPAGQFARERMAQIYGSPSGGQINVLQGVDQSNLPSGYLSMTREAACDAEGDFEFSSVANGDYYVQTHVVWTVGNRIIPEGGGLARLVQIRNGQNARIILN